MDEKFLLILSGPPGAGKSTIAHLVAHEFALSMALEMDFFWASVMEGFVAPWEPAAHDQNLVMLQASIASVAPLVAAGYATVLEGIVTPDRLRTFHVQLRELDVPVYYVVLRPTLEVCLVRSVDRLQEPRHAGALALEGPVRRMYTRFERLDAYEKHVIDSSRLSLEDTVRAVVDALTPASDFLVAASG